ncbi:hypothetical protein [Nonomuraea aridisoli]|uniref:hypothetical protein n=1 Tax=Nonomuraea aridisoli TaxID=2070368 RepID=UPI0015E8D858|nr:hypothetical protein [Nonomuraea aridisoli]
MWFGRVVQYARLYTVDLDRRLLPGERQQAADGGMLQETIAADRAWLARVDAERTRNDS